MKLSVLDQAPITKGNTAPNALQYAVELAVEAEKLGYERIWMAEHHNTKGFASSAPEITVSYIAAKTNRIRIGTGGTMVMHYSPYKMAEVFKTLCSLAPGRIDFGAGRAPGGDHPAMYALAEGRQPQVNYLYEKIMDTLQFINDKAPHSPFYNRVIATPYNIVLPQGWLLGSSGDSAIQAGRMGLGYSYAQFFNGYMNRKVFDAYREHFIPSAFMEMPNVMISYFVTVAETKEEAEYQGKPADISRLLFMKGHIDNLRITPEEAKDYPLTEMDRMWLKDTRHQHLIGTAKEVGDILRKEQEIYGIDEVMICSIPHSQEVRLNVYRLLAKELMD